jgi:integrase
MELTSEEFQAHLKEPLFISRIGELKHIHRQTAYMAMKEMAVAIGLPEKGINFAPHGCRKTFAYASIKNNPNDPRVIATLSSSLNHSSEAQTRTYADITSEDIERLYNSVNI